MKNLNRITPYKDKNESSIYENSLCRSWIIDECDEEEGGGWILEKVQFYKNDWYLFDINFNYKNSDEEPVLLMDYHDRIEMVDNCK